MASCDHDNKSQGHFAVDALSFNFNPQLNYYMLPTTKSTAFTFEAVLADNQPSTATVSTQFIGALSPDCNLSLLSVFKGPGPVSSRPPGSSARPRPSSAHVPSPMSRSAVGKNAHPRKQPAPKHTPSGHKVCGSLKKRHSRGEEPHSPPLIDTQYYSTDLTGTPSSSICSHNGLSDYPSPHNQYGTLDFPGSNHPFTSDHPASAPLAGFSPIFPTSVVPTSTDSSQQITSHYHLDRREADPELYTQQNTFNQPIKIDSSPGIPTESWIYSVASYQGETTLGASHSQLPQNPAINVHLAMNGEALSPQNASSGNHSPVQAAFTTFHDPCSTNVLNGGHTSAYTGRSGGLSASGSSSFQESGSVATPTSEDHSPHNSPFISSTGVMTSLPHDHYDSPYVERSADVQLLHCSQCTQRFASQEHFAKHQIKHQKLHRCRVPGCNRVEGFTTPNDRDRHEKSVHKTPGMYFRCLDQSCTSYLKTFARRDNLKDHLKRMHKMPPHIGEAEANEQRNQIADDWKVDITNPPSR